MSFREKCYVVIFEADTKLGKAFDVLLIFSILCSVLITIFESVPWIEANYFREFYRAEFFFTFFFTLEYGFRVYCARDRKEYIRSFFGVVDLLSIIPFYLSIIFPGAQGLTVVRGLRILRVFRVLKLSQYLHASSALVQALKGSWPKISVFLIAVVSSVLIIGALMYLVEGRENGFSSIPHSMYWAVVTMTTVGYGDIVPQTALGRFISMVLMIMGYGIIAVPTGIVSSEMAMQAKQDSDHEHFQCSTCHQKSYPLHSRYCNECGKKI